MEDVEAPIARCSSVRLVATAASSLTSAASPRCLPNPAPVVDTIGAGDCFAAAFGFGLAEGRSARERPGWPRPPWRSAAGAPGRCLARRGRAPRRPVVLPFTSRRVEPRPAPGRSELTGQRDRTHTGAPSSPLAANATVPAWLRPRRSYRSGQLGRSTPRASCAGSHRRPGSNAARARASRGPTSPPTPRRCAEMAVRRRPGDPAAGRIGPYWAGPSDHRPSSRRSAGRARQGRSRQAVWCAFTCRQ